VAIQRRRTRATPNIGRVVRQAYAHDAVVTMPPGDSPDALGGAITIALCGHWDHTPPCPLAPHYVMALPDGETVTVRILFATEPSNERRVRSLIAEALGTGELAGPDGGVATWRLNSAAAGDVRPEERDHAAGLIAHGLDPC
jgi:hypothetical protein